MNINKSLHTHSSKLERWLGTEEVEHLSNAMRAWYGPPIAVGTVEGNVWAHKGGDFTGLIKSGGFCSAVDYAVSGLYKRFKNAARKNAFQFSTGFASLSDLIAEASGGKRQELAFSKTGATGVIAVTNDLWGSGPQPAAGAAGAAAPGGTAHTKANTGALGFENAGGSDTLHYVSAFTAANVANTLLLYDRLFSVAKTMNSTATEAVTGVPTRYQSGTAGAADYIGGNFLFAAVGGTALAATAHNWTVCLYTDQASASSTLPSLTGVSGAIVRRFDHPISQWFAPLEAGDVGIKALTQMQCSATVATGVLDFVIGHPIAWFPCPVVNLIFVQDGINTAFNLSRIFDDACLTFLEVNKPATSATNYNGTITLVSG